VSVDFIIATNAPPETMRLHHPWCCSRVGRLICQHTVYCSSERNLSAPLMGFDFGFCGRSDVTHVFDEMFGVVQNDTIKM
jgi:hypothetical protein